MADQNPMLGALGLCRKAGKLVMGFDAVAESVMKGKAVLVLTAQDVSPRTALWAYTPLRTKTWPACVKST